MDVGSSLAHMCRRFPIRSKEFRAYAKDMERASKRARATRLWVTKTRLGIGQCLAGKWGNMESSTDRRCEPEPAGESDIAKSKSFTVGSAKGES